MLTIVAQLVLWAMVLLVALPVLVFVVQLAAVLLLPSRPTPRSAQRPRIAIIVPAHDEALGIVATLAAITPQLAAGDRLLVVADNCTDATASIAAAAGADVAIRTDAERRGKGYALDWGVRQLALGDAPDIAIVVDADCLIGAGTLDTLARTAAATARPAQGLYLMRAPLGAPPAARIAEFAWVVKNRLRPLGYHKLGLPCQLMGTGMAFPWALLERAELATDHIVEDVKLGADLALAGSPPIFCPDTLITSEFSRSRVGGTTQRTRWEHGHLSMMITYLPKLLDGAIRRNDRACAAMALDMCVPPLAMLVLAIGMAGTVTALGWATIGVAKPFAFVAATAAVFLIAIAVGWWHGGRHAVGLSDMLAVPGYVLSKVSILVAFFRKQQTTWVRSDRGQN